MDFLSADGFPITLDGVVEFRVLPEQVAEVFVKYNEDANGDAIDEEIISKIITPESRSLCRIGGSKLTGGQFISGNDREKFQRDLVKSLTDELQEAGDRDPRRRHHLDPAPRGDRRRPVRLREVAKQELAQYQQEKIQQLSEAQLKVQVVLAEQKKKLVEAEQGVVEKTTKAEQDQKVAVTLAEQKLKVAATQLEAAKDKASAIVAKAQADADVIRFNNKAELAGLAARVAAFDGDGAALARNILIGKIAPSLPDDPVELRRAADGPVRPVLARPQSRAAAPAPPRGRPRKPPVDAAAAELPSPTSSPPRRPGHELAHTADHAVKVLGLVVPGLPGRLRRDLAVDDLPDRGAPGIQPAAPLQGPLAPIGSRAPGPRGDAGPDRSPAATRMQVGILEAMPGPGRHFYSPLEYETKLVPDLVIPPGKIGVVVAKFGKPLPPGTYLADARGLPRHPPPRPDAGPLPDQRLCL